MEKAEKGGKEEMIYFILIIISLSVGSLIGISLMLNEERKLKPFRKAVKDATDQYINTLEKNNKFWQDEAMKWSGKYWELKVNK